MLKRDLKKDLEIIKKATQGPWRLAVLDKSSIFAEQATRITRCSNENGENDAKFIAEANEGWKHAIERALAAEAKLKELEKEIEQVTAAKQGIEELKILSEEQKEFLIREVEKEKAWLEELKNGYKEM